MLGTDLTKLLRLIIPNTLENIDPVEDTEERKYPTKKAYYIINREYIMYDITGCCGLNIKVDPFRKKRRPYAVSSLGNVWACPAKF